MKDLDHGEGTARRRLTGSWRALFSLLALSAAAFHLYTGAAGLLASHVQITVHWAFMSTLILLVYRARHTGGPGARPWLDLLVGVGSVVACAYLSLTVEDRILGVGTATPVELFLGTLTILVVLEAARRTTGPVLPLTCIALMLYALVGKHLPALIAHRGYEPERLIAFLYMSPEGIFSLPLAISASYVILFVLFGALLNASGAGQLFIEAAYAMAGRLRGGPAKTAVVASGALGTISGSPVANVVTTGTFTIPLMIGTGVKPAVAAAIEAVASTGGSVMPPIMGAAAFIMAEYLNVPYRDVAVAAVIPALLYYVTVYWMVDLEAARTGLTSLPADRLPRLGPVVLKSGHLTLALVVMVGLLLYGWSPLKSSFYAIVSLLLVTFLHPATRSKVRPGNLLKAVEDGISAALPVASATAAAGIIVGVVALTGLGVHFSTVMAELAGDSIPAALFLTMIAAMVLGCGMPISAVYIIMASLTAPALIRLGVEPLAAHMFIFYFSSFAAITPPVALASYAAAGLARAAPNTVGLIAFKFGLAAYLVPYMFAFAPTLLFQGTGTAILGTIVTALAGTYMLAVGVQGYSLLPHSWVERAVLLVGALGMIKPGLATDALGLGCALAVGILSYPRWRSRREAAVASSPAGSGAGS
jgi:TRAP transporter 4TM/12TM fusion protein